MPFKYACLNHHLRFEREAYPHLDFVFWIFALPFFPSCICLVRGFALGSSSSFFIRGRGLKANVSPSVRGKSYGHTLAIQDFRVNDIRPITCRLKHVPKAFKLGRASSFMLEFVFAHGIFSYIKGGVNSLLMAFTPVS